jgi:lactate dehydrogenase-like 2-hydroxyacid dehydrogenase
MAGTKETLVYHHFYTDKARLGATSSLYARSGLRVTDRLTREACDEAAYVVTKARPVDDEFASRFPNLRAVIVLGSEAWMVDLRSSRAEVLCIDEDRGYEVAEHAVALLLASIKRLGGRAPWRRRLSARRLYRACFPRTATETVGAHNWAEVVTGTLYRKRIGIVGYGAIGREIHKRLEGFGAEFCYYHHRPYPPPLERRLAIRFLELGPLFEQSDAVLVQLPLTNETRGMISADVLSRCKPSLALVNCGRASVIDQAALYAALRRGDLQSYAADVFWKEPMPLFTRFRLLSNCQITPHMAESLPGRKHDLLERAIELITLHGDRCGHV